MNIYYFRSLRYKNTKKLINEYMIFMRLYYARLYHRSTNTMYYFYFLLIIKLSISNRTIKPKNII